MMRRRGLAGRKSDRGATLIAVMRQRLQLRNFMSATLIKIHAKAETHQPWMTARLETKAAFLHITSGCKGQAWV